MYSDGNSVDGLVGVEVEVRSLWCLRGQAASPPPPPSLPLCCVEDACFFSPVDAHLPEGPLVGSNSWTFLAGENRWTGGHCLLSHWEVASGVSSWGTLVCVCVCVCVCLCVCVFVCMKDYFFPWKGGRRGAECNPPHQPGCCCTARECERESVFPLHCLQTENNCPHLTVDALPPQHNCADSVPNPAWGR